MTVEVGGAGTMGVSHETTMGTYLAPTKWIPIRSENLHVVEDKQYRMNIRGLADRSGQILGYTHVEGEITFEVTPDALVYFMYASRISPTKVTTTYTFVPAHVAKTSSAAGATNRKTMSLLITRGGNPFGYVGCAVNQWALTVENGVLMCTLSIVGMDEAAQSVGTPTWSSSAVVAGPGGVTLEVPTASARADADTFTATVNDNLVAANRLNGQRKAAYQNWGEREVTFEFEVDFDTLTDYAAFRAGTVQTATLKGISAAGTEEVTLVLNATASDTYETGLSSLGDVNRATISKHAFYSSTDAFTMTIKTAEVIT